jgi:type I restriction enzyme S subunit
MQSDVPMVKLGEVLTERQEKPDLESVMMGQIPIIAKIGFNTGIIEYRDGFDTKTDMILVKPGDLVVSGINAEKGAIALYDESNSKNCAATIHYSSYSIDKKKADPKFLWFFFRSEMFLNILIQSLPNGIKTEVKPFRLLKLEIPLPPLKEQQCIVVTLERLVAKIEDSRRQRTKAVDMAEALVIADARHIFEKMKISPTPLSTWVDNSRDGIQTGPFGAQLGTSDFQDTGHALITIGNVQYGGLRLEGLRFVSKEKAKQLERYTVTKGDIIFARMGTVGRCCVVPEEAQGWLFNYHIIRVAPDQQRINPRYLHWIIQASPDIESYLEEKIRGATRQGVNTKIVSELPCRVPSLSEQRRIVAHLDRLQVKVDEVKRLQMETEREIEALVPAVLAKAFGGAM